MKTDTGCEYEIHTRESCPRWSTGHVHTRSQYNDARTKEQNGKKHKVYFTSVQLLADDGSNVLVHKWWPNSVPWNVNCICVCLFWASADQKSKRTHLELEAIHRIMQSDTLFFSNKESELQRSSGFDRDHTAHDDPVCFSLDHSGVSKAFLKKKKKIV